MTLTCRLAVAFLCAPLVLPVCAQRTPMRTGPEMQPIRNDALSNADVVSLVTAGLDESIIVSKIRSAHSSSFDTSVEGLKALKAAGVTPEEMHAMMESSSGSAGYSNSDDPTQMHQPGVYVQIAGHDGQAHLLMLEHTEAVGEKGSRSAMANIGTGASMLPIPGFSAFGSGKTHMRAALNGPRSPVQIDDRNPSFYIYIQQDTRRFGGTDLSARDFSLLKMHPKSSSREVEISVLPGSGYGTSSVGIEDKAREVTTVQMIKPGIYLVKLAKPLKPGEYAFEHLLEGVFYDFGVTEAR